MPYIKANDGRRKALRKGKPALLAGELNYQIFYYIKHNIGKLENATTYEVYYDKIKKFVDQFLGKNPNYQRYNDMAGVLTLCYKEVNRRLFIDDTTLITIIDDYDKEIAKYEDTKYSENGDVE